MKSTLIRKTALEAQKEGDADWASQIYATRLAHLYVDLDCKICRGKCLPIYFFCILFLDVFQIFVFYWSNVSEAMQAVSNVNEWAWT